MKEHAQAHRSPQAILCEVGWEVCQQVGGIHTVLRSKAPSIMDRWEHENYVLVGPYVPGVSTAEFEELEPGGLWREVIDGLAERGVIAHYGRWLISGQPRVILLDPAGEYGRMAEIKYRLWEHHDVRLPAVDELLDGVVAFGHMVEEFFRVLAGARGRRLPIIGHFHEWMAGAAIPELRRDGVPVSIVFTTHATTLGRYLAMNDPWFYDHVPFVNWLGDARHYGIEPQVRIERAAAHGAHVFTTLSEITAYECQFLIGRRPDVLLPNGINLDRFVAMHEFQNLHRQYKDKINQFVMGHFFPSYTFDLDQTLYFFSTGRYEYRNKGFDLAIDALADLNVALQQANSDKTVVFFLTTRRAFRSINAEVLQARAQMEEIRKTCWSVKDQLGDRLFHATALGRFPPLDQLVDDHLMLQLRRMRHSWRLRRLPAIVTHDIVDDAGDQVLNHLRARDLINRPEDRVKVVYYPDFLQAVDPLLGLDYGEFVRGCHMGIFPSHYEPWGYTPEECMARGVPAVTSDLAGFGTHLLENMPDHRERGLYVVRRRYASYESSVRELTECMMDLVRMDRRGRIDLRNRVESSAEGFDWRQMIHHYIDAYELVLQRTLPAAGA